MDKTNARRNGRDIYEATEKDYDTTDYRRKLCNKWISHQQAQPANLHVPTDLESIAPDHTNKLKMRKSQKRQANGKISIDNTKKSKLHMDAKFDEFLDFEMNNDDFKNNRAKSLNDDWFLSKPNAHRKKKKNTENETRKNHEIPNGGSHLKNTRQPRSLNAHHRTAKRSHAADPQFGFYDHDYDKDVKCHLSFDFNSNDSWLNELEKKADEKLDNGFDDFHLLADLNDSEKENRIFSSTVKYKRNSKQHISYLPNIPKTIQPERKTNKAADVFATPKLCHTYKMIEETNYLETPIWEKPEDDSYKLMGAEEKSTQNRALALRKSDHQYALEWNDGNKHGHGKINDDPQQYAYSKVSEYLEKPLVKAKKGLNLLAGTILNHNGSSNTQPINIYCNSLINKLIIKTD